MAGATDVEILAVAPESLQGLDDVDREADLILLSREALALGLDDRLSRPERLREWTYEFDPSGLELLRRSIEHVAASRARGGAIPEVVAG